MTPFIQTGLASALFLVAFVASQIYGDVARMRDGCLRQGESHMAAMLTRFLWAIAAAGCGALILALFFLFVAAKGMGV